MAVQDTILGGPSKFDLMVSLLHGVARKKRVHVDFEIRCNDPTITCNWEIYINSLEREDGSGEQWLFQGYVRMINLPCKGFYSTKTRKGWLEIIER